MGPRAFATLRAYALAAASVLAGGSGCTLLAGVEDLTLHDAATTIPIPPKGDAGTRDASLRDGGQDAFRQDAGLEAGPPPGGALVVASSDLASDWCVVTNAGDVECWGQNESGELGNGTLVTTSAPQKVQGLPGPASSVAVGVGSACALTQAGAAYCWGNSDDGELGNGTTNQSTRAVPATGLESGVTAISCGYGTACAIKAGGVWCWGSANAGTAGTSGATDAYTPTPVPGLASGVTSVSIGGTLACAVKSGAILCWGGFDGNGELGNGTTSGSYTPVPVSGLGSGMTAVSAGTDFACGLNGDGGVLCWGDGIQGQLGNGQASTSSTPVAVTGLDKDVVALSAGAASVTAIKRDGSVVAWGVAADGELGNGSYELDSGVGVVTTGISTLPVAVKNLDAGAVSVSTGQAPCVATTTGAVLCWGFVGENAPLPVAVQNLGPVTSLTTGGSLSPDLFACAIDAQGAIFCWGGNSSGQLGNGSTAASSLPVESPTVNNGATVVSGGRGGNFACAIVYGVAYCWGDNTHGQLGNDSTTSSGMPVGVQGLTSSVLTIAAGGTSACALVGGAGDAGSDAAPPDGGAASGRVMCWGDNTYGQLGNGSTTNSLVPIPVSGLESGVTDVTVGFDFACALRVDGTVECWGLNANGNLGDGTTQTRLAPTKVTGLSGATMVSAGLSSACAVAGGIIQCWGDDTRGQLGNDMSNSSSVPVAAYGIAGGASQVSVGAGFACATVAGGAQCWGFGALGIYFTPYAFSVDPTSVVNLSTGVSAVSAWNGSACAAVTTGVDCWGLNSAGQLGNGGAVDSFLPVPVAGFP